MTTHRGGIADLDDPSDEITAEEDKPDAKSEGGYKATIISEVDQRKFPR